MANVSDTHTVLHNGLSQAAASRPGIANATVKGGAVRIVVKKAIGSGDSRKEFMVSYY